MAEVKTKRHSGIELLRIMAACAVVVLHYGNPKMGGALDVVGGGRFYLISLLITICCCAVNVFVLISGYFLSQSPKRTLGKPFTLYLQVVIFHFIAFSIGLALSEFSFEPTGLIPQFLPTNYFVTIYASLYFISPCINSYLKSISQESYKRIIIILMILFSIYPSLMDVLREFSGNELTGTSTIGNWGSQYGYTIVNFVLLYIIGAYIRKYGIPAKIGKGKWIIAVISVCIIFGWRIVVSHLHPMGQSSATSYLNPFVILLAVCVFGIFREMKFESKVINELSKAAFTCFLFHLVVIERIGIRDYAPGPFLTFALHFVLSVIGIYLISYVIYKLYSLVFNPLIKRLDRYRVSYEENTPFISKSEV